MKRISIQQWTWMAVILFFLIPTFVCAQFLRNSSLHGRIGISSLPYQWYACNPHSTPDTQPYNVQHLSTESETFMSLVTRGQRELPSDNFTEAAQTQLMGILTPENCYHFTLDISYSTVLSDDYSSFDNPVILKIWGGADTCDKAQLLWQSPVINDTLWTTYSFVFSPEAEIEWIILEADYASLPEYFGNVLIDNLKLDYLEVDLGADTTICHEEKVMLNANINGASAYRWSNGATSAMIEAGGGKHWVEVTVGDCSITDTIQITELAPLPELLPQDTFLCQQAFLTLDASVAHGTYLWSNGFPYSSIRVNEPGTYWVEVSNGCETKRETVEVYRVPELKIDLPADTVLCLEETLSLDVSSAYASYQWSTGSTESSVMIDQPDMYAVTVDNHCQSVTKEIAVDFRLCCFEEDCCTLTIPNVFTPNADKSNDTFVITSTHQPSIYELTIFNRWGETVYKTYQLDAFWDGQKAGSGGAAGVYYYQIKMSCPFLNKTVERDYKGWVQLLRKGNN